MLRIFLLAVIFSVEIFNFAEAAEKPRITVMDLGQYNGAITKDIVSENLGRAASEHVLQALQESGKFFIVAQEPVAEKIAADALQTSGVIPPSMARKIAAALNVDYIIYGTINGVTGDTMTIEVISNGANVHTVRVCLIVDVIHAKTGRVIAVRGEGASKSSRVKFGKDDVGFITIGRKKISQDSVHSAIEKAAYAMVDKMVADYADFWEETAEEV